MISNLRMTCCGATLAAIVTFAPLLTFADAATEEEPRNYKNYQDQTACAHPRTINSPTPLAPSPPRASLRPGLHAESLFFAGDAGSC